MDRECFQGLAGCTLDPADPRASPRLVLPGRLPLWRAGRPPDVLLQTYLVNLVAVGPDAFLPRLQCASGLWIALSCINNKSVVRFPPGEERADGEADGA